MWDECRFTWVKMWIDVGENITIVTHRHGSGPHRHPSFFIHCFWTYEWIVFFLYNWFLHMFSRSFLLQWSDFGFCFIIFFTTAWLTTKKNFGSIAHNLAELDVLKVKKNTFGTNRRIKNVFSRWGKNEKGKVNSAFCRAVDRLSISIIHFLFSYYWFKKVFFQILWQTLFLLCVDGHWWGFFLNSFQIKRNLK